MIMVVNQHNNVLLMKSEQQSPALTVLQLSREFVRLLLWLKPMHKGAMVSSVSIVKRNLRKQGWLRFTSKTRKMQLPLRLPALRLS
mgnify:CR=1 FL=1